MLGTHTKKTIGESSYTYLDYVVLELYDNNGDEYLLWLSLNDADVGQKWIKRDDTVDTNYKANSGPSFNPTQIKYNQLIAIGNRFQLIYKETQGQFILTIDNDAEIEINMMKLPEGLSMNVVQADRM